LFAGKDIGEARRPAPANGNCTLVLFLISIKYKKKPGHSQSKFV